MRVVTRMNREVVRFDNFAAVFFAVDKFVTSCNEA